MSKNDENSRRRTRRGQIDDEYKASKPWSHQQNPSFPVQPPQLPLTQISIGSKKVVLMKTMNTWHGDPPVQPD
eukprot:scaffold120488_cov20-Tisochrysis_lutea.AAC.1